jgi:hypothetical protein
MPTDAGAERASATCGGSRLRRRWDAARARGGRGGSDLWDECRRRVEGLTLPEPFDAEAFIELLAEQRGRRIGLLPVEGATNLPCGLVITTEQSDWIVYRADTTALHRRHILLHEAAHILCGHGERGDTTAAAARSLMPHLGDELVRSVLGRTVYSEPDEREAELLASLILHRVGRRDRHTGREPGRPSRLDALFGLSEG